MQTVAWMSFSDSTHFSDQKPYKILVITSYSLKDMNYASFEHLQEFYLKTENSWNFFSPKGS
jgi:hypothetical protein